MYPTVLIPIEDLPKSHRVLPLATKLASSGRGRAVLMQAVSDPDLRTRAESILGRMGDQFADQPFQVETRVQVGTPGPLIVECARDTQADLIAMATDRWSDVDRWLNGSVTDWVVRHTSVPVLVVTPDSDAPRSAEAREPRVLVPLDESALAEEILGPATAIARLLHAEVLLLEAIYDEASRPFAEAYLTSAADRLSKTGPHVTTEVTLGPADAAIEQVAQKAGASMIAMATHGRSGLARLLLGSVATRTLQHATTPVLLVRPVAVRELVETSPEQPPFLIVG